MSLEQEATENLFSYGTLQTEAVQLATFGRRLEGKPDVLIGYTVAMIRIEDDDFVAASGSAYHRNLKFTGIERDLVEGTVLTLSKTELELADAYEPDDYGRTLVRLRSGVNAWVYASDRQ